MRTLAIGDIHGCLRALDTLLAAVNPQPEDQIITLGDYVDRGPDSFGVIDRLLALKKTHPLVPLRGNHEQMMVEARQDSWKLREWLECGGRATLTSYAVLGDASDLVDVPDHHWEFLEEECRRWHEIDTHFFVHANAYPDMALDEQPDYMLLWETFGKPRPHESGKIMVCGHTAQRLGVPLNLGHAVCIDTWVYGKGWLTCLDVRSGKIWQANEAGQKRTIHLDECR